MAWDGREFQRRRSQAIDAYDRREANELIEELVA